MGDPAHDPCRRTAHGIGQVPRYEPFPAPVVADGEAVLTVTAAAPIRSELRAGGGPERIRYLQVGIGGSAALDDAAAAYRDLLQLVAAGEISLDIDPVPLAKVEQAWPEAGSDRRIVFVP